MKKFLCNVTLSYEYEIDIDDEELGEEFLENYKKHFRDFDTWEEHAEYIAIRKAREDEFIEGYGIPLINGENPRYDNDERSLEKAININIIYEDEVDVDCIELST